jgi:hypothetical protein
MARSSDLLVAVAVLLVHFVVRDAHPAGDRRLQHLGNQLVAIGRLELRRAHRRPLELEDLLVPREADEVPVLLEPWHADDALVELGIAHGHTNAVGFRENRFFVDQLLDDPLGDAELSQHALVELVAVRRSQGLDLRLVGALVRSHQDFTSVDGREDVGPRRRRRRFKNPARRAGQTRPHNSQAPRSQFCAAHPVEHRHVGAPPSSKYKLCHGVRQDRGSVIQDGRDESPPRALKRLIASDNPLKTSLFRPIFSNFPYSLAVGGGPQVNARQQTDA